MTTLRDAAQQALEQLRCNTDNMEKGMSKSIQKLCAKENREAMDTLRAALAQEEPMRPTFQEMQNAAANLRVMKEMFGDPAASCDIAEDGVCEVIDCCRKSPLILEALEIGYDSAQAEAAQYHAAMAGYRPERHAEMDADVAKIAAAITALRDALAQQAPKGGGNLPPPLQAEPVEEPVAFDADGFRAFVLRELPDGTDIGSGAWWADHLTAWAQRFIKRQAALKEKNA